MREARLLIVEDEAGLLESLRLGLTEDSFAVTCASSAENAERLIATQAFDAIVLDLRLPGKDGIELLHELRAAGNPTPVLILTARGSLDDRITGLDGGADDYLAKPFAFAELRADRSFCEPAAAEDRRGRGRFVDCDSARRRLFDAHPLTSL
jgi:DNA-binding response OmpR family regulator